MATFYWRRERMEINEFVWINHERSKQYANDAFNWNNQMSKLWQ